MIRLLTINNKPVDLPGDSVYVTHVWGGLDTLDFDMDPHMPGYSEITEEIPVRFNGIQYTVKGINERRSVSSIHCAIDLDALKSTVHYRYNSGSVTLSELLTALLPSGWTVSGASVVTIRRTIEMESCTNYDIIMQAADTYGVCYRWNNIGAVLTVIKPDNIQPSGTYLTDQLNLQELSLKGSTDDFCTRLYPYGAIDESTGLPLTIAAVNDGTEYVDNHTYSDKVISAIWSDERYTDAQSLKNAAMERLKALALPVRSYECSVVDLAVALPEKYGELTIELYAVLILLDRTRSSRIQHRVVEYVEYPYRPDLNKVTLSSVAVKITTKIDRIKTELSEEIKVERGKISELRQDADAISARVGETYTKGETDANIEASVSVAKDMIRQEVSETYVTGNQLNEVKSTIEQQSDQLEFRFTNINGELQNVSDALAENQELLEEYIRFKGALMELGKLGNDFTAELSNEKLAFKQNGVEIAYISNNKLYITDAEVSEHLAMGKADRGYYDLYVRSNGHLTLKRRR